MARLTAFSVALLLCVNAVWSADTSEFDCHLLLPTGKSADTSNSNYKLSVSAKTFTTDDEIQVKISGEAKFKKFALQARLAVQETPVGTWKTATGARVSRCHHDKDTVSSSDDKATKLVSFIWNPPAEANLNEPVVFVAGVVDTDGKAHIVQFGPVTAKQEEKDEEEEESRRTQGEEEERPAKPAAEEETTSKKDNEDPNAGEKEQERQRNEALSRDMAGEEAAAKKPQTANSEEQEGSDRGRYEEDEEEESSSRRREEAAEEEDGEQARRERMEYEMHKAEEDEAQRYRILEEIRKMEEDDERQERERQRRIKWEEEDEKRFRQQEKLRKAKEEMTRRKETKIPQDEMSLGKDGLFINDGNAKPESGATCLATSIASFLSFIVALFLL